MLKYVVPVLVAFLAYYALKVRQSGSVIITREQLLQSYDYVVVGGGAAGGVVAARLSELDNATVLVLEAGQDDLLHPYTQWLSFEQRLQNTPFDWQYQTVPQKECCDGLVGKRGKWPRGKGLGGSSSHHGGVHGRGSRYDYDLWADTLGPGSGWGFQDVLPYFKKIENVENIQHLKDDVDLHSVDGPITLTEESIGPLAAAMIKAAQRLGFPRVNDSNAMRDKDSLQGFGTIQRQTRGGRRQSTAEAYLRPAMRARPGRIHVLTEARVTRILLDSLVASGVEFVHGAEKTRVRAEREVVVCAGAIGSPQLLLLSGIGPRRELEQHGVPVLVENEQVGRNLFDHPWAPITATINDTLATYHNIDPDNTLSFALAKLMYHLFASGPLTGSFLEMQGFVRSGLTEDPWPDLHIYLFGSAVASPYQAFNLEEKAYRTLYPSELEEPGRQRIGMSPVVLHPRNSGEVRLSSGDPFDHPVIDPKYLHNEQDVGVLAKGLEICHRLLSSPELAPFDVRLSATHTPGCERLRLFSPEYMKCHARNMLLTMYHPVGTCRMGRTPRDGVVDTKLKVHGVDRLRVVDASVFPHQVSANTVAPTIMVAEKAVDLMKEDYLSVKGARH